MPPPMMPPPGLTPAPSDDDNDGSQSPDDPTSQPVEFDLHIKADPNEIQAAVDVLREAGMEDLAQQLATALDPNSKPEDPTAGMADELEAMGNNPHSGGGM